MKHIRKTLSLLFLVLMLIGMLPAPAAATDMDETSAGTPVVTKNPTGETVIEGGSAVFVAKATNTKQYVWEIAIADAVIDCADLPGYLGTGVTQLQYSCLGNPMDRGAWQATVYGVAKESDMTKELNNTILH